MDVSNVLDGIDIAGTGPEAWNAEAVALFVRWQTGMGDEPDASGIDWQLWLNRTADRRVVERACEDVARRRLDLVEVLRKYSYGRSDVRAELQDAQTALYWMIAGIESESFGVAHCVGFWANEYTRMDADAFYKRPDAYRRGVLACDIAERAAELTYGRSR